MQDAHSYLVERIIGSDLEPGSLISEAKLAERLSVSRGQIRDAIESLEKAELVSVVPRAGILISPVSFPSIQAVYEARLCMEPRIAGLAANRCTAQDCAELRSLAEMGHEIGNESSGRPFWSDAVAQRVMADRRIHTKLAILCQNRFLKQALEPLLTYNARIWVEFFRHLEGQDPSTYFISHEDLLTAVCGGDAGAADSAMREHLEACWSMLFDAFSPALH